MLLEFHHWRANCRGNGGKPGPGRASKRRPQRRGPEVGHGGRSGRTRHDRTDALDAARDGASARHVPNEVYAVPEIPRTLTGKKMELPVRKLLLGHAADKVASADAMANPASFAFYVELARQLGR